MRQVKMTSAYKWLVISVGLVIFSDPADADYCLGASHISCFVGIDVSGRTPQQLYAAAVEGAREATTPEQESLALQAEKDAFNPAEENQRAAYCNQTAHGYRQFQACLAGQTIAPSLVMTVPCQQNLTTGQVFVDMHLLPASSGYRVDRYTPEAHGNGYTTGQCQIQESRGP
jgi:hypothetical protein